MRTIRQQVAIDNTCRLAEQTMHPMFSAVDSYSNVSTILTFNSGYE